MRLSGEQKCDIAQRELEELRDEIDKLKDEAERVLDNHRVSLHFFHCSGNGVIQNCSHNCVQV